MATKRKLPSQTATELLKTRSLRLRPEDQMIADSLEKKLGVDFSQIVRMGLRKLAEHEGVKVA